jgi:hypothetical protein
MKKNQSWDYKSAMKRPKKLQKNPCAAMVLPVDIRVASNLRG